MKENPCIFNYSNFLAVAVIAAFNWGSPAPIQFPKAADPPRISISRGLGMWLERFCRARIPPLCNSSREFPPLCQRGGREGQKPQSTTSSALPSSEGKSRTWQKQKFLGNQALNLSHKYHNSLTDPAIIRSWPMSDIRTQFVELMCHMK